MPKLLDDIDPVEAELDLVMTEAEEQAALTKLAATGSGVAPDLSDGGMVGEVRVTPTLNGRKLNKGRPVARRAWMWDGTETVLPLAYNPNGKTHDGARHYLRKRHCTCCRFSGFTGVQCPQCVKTGCAQCNSSLKGNTIIPCFYLKAEDVPFPVKFYGNVDCFLPFCQRKGKLGFKTEQDMRLHAQTRHRLEWQAHLSTLHTDKDAEIEALRQQVAALNAAVLTRGLPQGEVADNAPAPAKPPKKEVTGTPEAPLYVSDKDKRKASIQ